MCVCLCIRCLSSKFPVSGHSPGLTSWLMSICLITQYALRVCTFKIGGGGANFTSDKMFQGNAHALT